MGESANLARTAGSASSWLAFGYLVLIDSLTGFALYNWLLRTTTITVVSHRRLCRAHRRLPGRSARPRRTIPPRGPHGAAAIVMAVAAEVRATT
jgi:hypothetical protein